MFPSAAGRRLVILIGRAVAVTAGTKRPQPRAAHLPNHSYSSAPVARTPDPDTASYLAASCGLSPAAAAAASRWLRIRSTAMADDVLALLRRHGFSGAQIARLLRMSPYLLNLHPDRNIRPKLEFFASLGFTPAVLASASIFHRSLEKHLVPCVEFLRGVLGTDANIRAAVTRNPYGALSPGCDNNMRPAVEALRRHGLSEEAISKLLVLQVGVLSMPPDRIAGIFEDLEVLGLPVTDTRFVRCFSVMCNLKRESAWRRMALYQNFGLSKSEVAKAFMMQPSILELTDESIQGKLCFFRDELKIALPQVIAHPVVLNFSVEKNILPKYAVLSVLMREGKIQRDINLVSLLTTCSKYFSERYVKRYEKDVPDVGKAYQGKIEFREFMGQFS